ncbi:MAG: glutaredoxin family protein [Pseudohongiellaceae bacterium]
MARLILYTTAGCHLCEQAEVLLAEVLSDTGFSLCKVDIATDAGLVERYGIRIPVVRKDTGHEELGWPFDVNMLKDFLDHAD